MNGVEISDKSKFTKKERKNIAMAAATGLNPVPTGLNAATADFDFVGDRLDKKPLKAFLASNPLFQTMTAKDVQFYYDTIIDSVSYLDISTPTIIAIGDMRLNEIAAMQVFMGIHDLGEITVDFVNWIEREVSRTKKGKLKMRPHFDLTITFSCKAMMLHDYLFGSKEIFPPFDYNNGNNYTTPESKRGKYSMNAVVHLTIAAEKQSNL